MCDRDFGRSEQTGDTSRRQISSSGRSRIGGRSGHVCFFFLVDAFLFSLIGILQRR